ncbi:uncharacterized protein [Halyomorpha halys]|uniref:uncharacterized protein n=1 Tax=Halyomorpha halys TaxID=286706 RepID=UPI0006D52425|nr:uncharacterized protein LOC106681102 [Halyomorpha halys]XP_014276745.1 uncharacterized protein LOC106681102 [Halyomorpha halys]
MQVDRRSPRPQTPRGNDLRDSGPIASRLRYLPRPNSAKVAEKISARRNLLNGKFRSNSARAKPEEPPEPPLDVSDQETPAMHKLGCPWLKARSRSKYAVGVSESSSGIMHPKPWGARNPTDIPCFCNLTHNRNSKENQQIHRPKVEIPLPNKNCKAKIAEIVDNFGIFLERRKIRISENEVAFLMKKIEEKLQKFVDKSKKEQKDHNKNNKIVRNQSPIQRPHPPPGAQNAMSRDQLLELQKAKMAGQGQANILGKMETKKYLLELTAEEPCPPNFRNILGMNPTIIHPHPDKMLIAMDDKQPYLAIPEDYRHYSMKTIDMDNYTGVVHHQAENTTLLLASNPALARRPMHTPPQNLIQKPHHIGYKQVRRQ